MKEKVAKRLTSYIQVLRDLPTVLFLHAWNKHQWRKQNRDDLFLSRITIRAGSVTLVLAMIIILAFPNPSSAVTFTWTQTNWDGGVGSSTSSQYSSASNVDVSNNGDVRLSNLEKATNTNFNSNLTDWSTGNSETVPTLIQIATPLNNNSNVSSFAVTFSKALTPGASIIVFATYRSNPGTVAGTGFSTDTSYTNTTTSAERIVVLRKTVASASDSTTVTITNSTATTGTLYAYEVAGVGSLDKTSTADNGSTSTTNLAIPATATTTSDNEIAFAAISSPATNAANTWDNSFVAATSTGSYSGYVAHKELTSKQTVSSTYSAGTARTRAGIIVTYKGWATSVSNSLQTTVRQSSSNAANAVTTATGTYTYTPKVGSTLLAAFTLIGDPGTIVAPSGWNLILEPRSPSSSARTVLYSKIAGSSESTSYNWSWDIARTGRLEMFEVVGLQSASAVDTYMTFQNASIDVTPIYTTPSFIPTVNNAFLFTAMGINSTTGPPNDFTSYGFVNGAGSTNSVQRSGYRLMTTPSSLAIPLTSSSPRTAQGYIISYKTLANYVSSSLSTSIKHAGAGSAKLEATPWVQSRLTQSINVGDTESYSVSAYVYSDGSAIDANTASLYYNGSSVSTTYTSAGSGWYKLSGTVTGANAARDFGVEAKPGTTIYVDDFSVNRYANSGTVISNIFDTGHLSNWGNLRFTYTGSGSATVKVRSSNDSNMSTAQNFSSCASVSTGSDLSSGTNGCVTDGERYVQYQITITGDTTATPAFQNIEIDYTGADQTPPDENASNITMYKSNGGTEVPENSWTNSLLPYFTWDPAVDDIGGIGIAGYCVYLGTSDTADPITTKGLLGTGDLNVYDECPFATANPYLDLSAVDVMSGSLSTSNTPYYLNIKAIDGNYNIYDSSAASFHFRFDNTAPSNPAYITAPSSFISTKSATLAWPTSGGDSPSDSNSGVAGLQYKIGASGTWYGDNHTGDQDITDLLDNDGSYVTQSTPDFDNLIEGSNVIYFRTWDEAGNVSVSSVTTSLKINTAGAPSSPQNIEATPSTNTTNSFAFSWDVPATYVGNVSSLTYCYTINTLPTSSNCSFTAAGVTSVPAGAYATQPGANTFYVVAKDESGNINYATASSVEFTANTSAPGMPLNPDVADTSVKASSNWRLVVSWETPTDIGAGVSKYDVYRSTNGTDFTKAGSTSGTSYVDTGLDSVRYYYKIKACDSANNCGANSTSVDKIPTGRFTSPPNITSTGGVPKVSDIETRSATFSWTTDREADSKVAFGVKSGDYSSTEAYRSTQTLDHEVKLDNLTPGTTYYFVVRWTDTDGNTGESSEFTFETAPPPVVQDVATVGIGLNNATLQYTTSGASAVKIYFGPTNGFGGVIDVNTSRNVSTYTSQLKNLLDGTKYYFRINTFDSNGNEYLGTTLSFETPPAPRISNLRFQPVDNEPSSTQMISWDTNVATTSEISYGVAGGETLNAIDTTMTKTHEMIIRQLQDDSQYVLVARSRDASGNLATSDQQVFRTELDTRPPKVSDVKIVSSIQGTGSEARGQIIISWKTDEPATSQVAYGEGTSGDLNNFSSQDARLTYDHAVVISDLNTSKVYRVQAVSFDKGNNKGTGEPQTAIIGRSSESALSIIFSVLQKIFGVN